MAEKSEPIYSADDVEELMTRAIKRAFTDIGINADDPLAMQRDMAFLHTVRTSFESTRKTAWTTAVTVIAGAFITLVWYAIKLAIRGEIK